MSNEQSEPGNCINIENEDTSVATTEVKTEGDAVENTNGISMSKNQMKKMRAKEKLLEKRKIKRVEEKERKKAKRQMLREAGLGHTLVKFKGTLMKDSSCKIKVAVDMAYDTYMAEKDQRGTVQQLNFCYAANRRTENPLQYYVVGFNGPSREVYNNVKGNGNQDIFIEDKSLEEVFPKEDIVYLSAESDNVLNELDSSKVYVIGGLIDHNSHKGLCHSIAEAKGFAHARLPIDEFVSMKTRKVLTINHVFEILVHFTVTNDWEQSFFKVIPQRKGIAKKDDPVISDTGLENAENLDVMNPERSSECSEVPAESEKSEVVL